MGKSGERMEKEWGEWRDSGERVEREWGESGERVGRELGKSWERVGRAWRVESTKYFLYVKRKLWS